jgi:hypothetical protein
VAVAGAVRGGARAAGARDHYLTSPAGCDRSLAALGTTSVTRALPLYNPRAIAPARSVTAAA